jgi:hypothetical protein
MDVHDHVKYLKHGYSKVTDHACREIRHGRLTREQAQSLVRHHEAQPMTHLGKFCEWLGVDDRALTFIFNQHRNLKVWQEKSPGDWCRKQDANLMQPTIPLSVDSASLGFEVKATLQMDKPDKYITIGKGYPL